MITNELTQKPELHHLTRAYDGLAAMQTFCAYGVNTPEWYTVMATMEIVKNQIRRYYGDDIYFNLFPKNSQPSDLVLRTDEIKG